MQILSFERAVKYRFEEGQYDQVARSRERCNIDDYSSHPEVG